MLKRLLRELSIWFTYNIPCVSSNEHDMRSFRKRYQITEEIARGGFGIVTRAEVKAHDKEQAATHVAVKCIRHRAVREWTRVDGNLIPSEICFLELCNGVKGVVGIVDWFVSSKAFIIVMERPPNSMDLFDLVSVFGRLEEVVARHLFNQVVKTVQDLHATCSVVHQDLKAENIVVDLDRGTILIVDFGAADYVHSARTKLFQGTKLYCSPEWFSKPSEPVEAMHPEAVAGWQLGVMLYFIVTNHLPFRNEMQICTGHVRFPTDHVSEDCKHLIRNCLAYSPQHRFTPERILEHRWSILPTENFTDTFEEYLLARCTKRRVVLRRGSVTGFSSSELPSEEECSHRRHLVSGQCTPEPLCFPTRVTTRRTSSSATLNGLEHQPSTAPSCYSSCVESVVECCSDDRISFASFYESVISSNINTSGNVSVPPSTDGISSAISSMYYSATDAEASDMFDSCIPILRVPTPVHELESSCDTDTELAPVPVTTTPTANRRTSERNIDKSSVEVQSVGTGTPESGCVMQRTDTFVCRKCRKVSEKIEETSTDNESVRNEPTSKRKRTRRRQRRRLPRKKSFQRKVSITSTDDKQTEKDLPDPPHGEANVEETSKSSPGQAHFICGQHSAHKGVRSKSCAPSIASATIAQSRFSLAVFDVSENLD